MRERRTTVRDMTERRKYARFSIDQMIELSYGREQYVEAAGVDLSEKGVLCLTSEPVEPGARVFLMFQVPADEDSRTIKCEGVVVRCNQKGNQYTTAVSFSDLSAEDEKVIEEYSRLRLRGA